MKGILNIFKTLFDTIVNLFNMLMNVFKLLGMMLSYIGTIITLALNQISTLPTWLQAFAVITLAISVIYIIIGRNAGKSE